MARLSKAAESFIRDNYKNFSAQELAKRFGVPPKQIVNFLKRINIDINPENAERGEHRARLLNSVHWKKIKKQFNTDELEFFQERYCDLMEQFAGDSILATEETQIHQVIQTEILIARNLEEKNASRNLVVEYERLIKEILRAHQGNVNNMSDEDKRFISDLEVKLSAARNSEQARTSELVKFQERHSSLMKDLKGTREQRIKQIDSGKTTFVDLVKSLYDPEYQEREVRSAELIKLAAEKEYRRLGVPYQFGDGIIEPQILNAETVEESSIEESYRKPQEEEYE